MLIDFLTYSEVNLMICKESGFADWGTFAMTVEFIPTVEKNNFIYQEVKFIWKSPISGPEHSEEVRGQNAPQCEKAEAEKRKTFFLKWDFYKL